MREGERRGAGAGARERTGRSGLFPWPPRDLRWARPVQVALRSVHVAAMAVVLGGLAFDVPDARLHAAGIVTVASGAGLLAVELARTGVYLYTLAGAVTIGKLGLLGLGAAFPAARFELYLAATLLAAVASHASWRWRHWSLLDRRTLTRE